jgi:YHS domain-containing protein
MKAFRLRMAIVVLGSGIPCGALAQHETHQSAVPKAASAEMTQCLRVQPLIEHIITGATGRAEAARLSNNPAEMRAALEGLEAALRDIRAQSASCSMPPPASTDPHAGHTPTSGAAAPNETMTPASGNRSVAEPAAPHAEHASPASTPTDPVTGLTVDPVTALRTTYRGLTYYFSSEQSRKAFLQNPAKFAKKPEK